MEGTWQVNGDLAKIVVFENCCKLLWFLNFT